MITCRGALALQRVEVLVDRVGRAQVPVVAHPLLRRQDLDELAELLGDHAPALPDVAVEREGLVLGGDEDAPQARVDAVAEREIDDAVGPAEVDRRLGPVLGQGVEPLADAAGQHDDEGVFQHGLFRSRAGVRRSRIIPRGSRPVFGLVGGARRGDPALGLTWQSGQTYDRGRYLAGSATRGGMSTLLRASGGRSGAVVACGRRWRWPRKRSRKRSRSELRRRSGPVDRRPTRPPPARPPAASRSSGNSTISSSRTATRPTCRSRCRSSRPRSPRRRPWASTCASPSAGSCRRRPRWPPRTPTRRRRTRRTRRRAPAPDRCPVPVSLRGRLLHRHAGAGGRAASAAAPRLCRVARRLRRLRRAEGEAGVAHGAPRRPPKIGVSSRR